MSRRFFEIVLLIKRTCVDTEEMIRGEFRLTQAELNGHLAVRPGESLSGAEFSLRMGISPSRGSRVLAGMVRKGFLKSAPIPDDRRSVTISLTQKGRKMRADLELRMNACGEQLLSPLSAGEKNRLLGDFGLIERAFETKP
jgi:MarR family transcriptional regulator, organic hydroperoxide resistance regulator